MFSVSAAPRSSPRDEKEEQCPDYISTRRRALVRNNHVSYTQHGVRCEVAGASVATAARGWGKIRQVGLCAQWEKKEEKAARWARLDSRGGKGAGGPSGPPGGKGRVSRERNRPKRRGKLFLFYIFLFLSFFNSSFQSWIQIYVLNAHPKL
jgi:hypothetical protein